MATSPKFSDPEVLARIAGLTLRARHVVEGTISGLHRSPFHGFNVEFAEYREYSPGDDLRRLDWRVLGRTDRFYVKQYEEESNLRATFVLDCSASMSYGSGPAEQVRVRGHGRGLAGHAAGRAAGPGGAGAVRRPGERGPASGGHAGAVGSDHRPAGTGPADSRDRIGQRAANAQRTDSRSGDLIIVFSDLLTDLDSFYDGLRRLQYRGHEIIVFHVLDRDEIELPFNDLVMFRDIEGSEELLAEPWAFRKTYQAAMQQFLDEVRGACGDRGIDYLLLRTDQPLADALSHYLHARERLKHLNRPGRR